MKKFLLKYLAVDFTRLLYLFFFKKNIRIVLRHISSFEYLLCNNVGYLYQKDKSFCYCSPVYQDDLPEVKKLHHIRGITCYAVEVEGVIIVGASNFLFLQNNQVVNCQDSFLKKTNQRYYDSVIVFNFRDIYFLAYNKQILCFKEAINFVGGNSDNYYHLVYEIIGKFQLLNTLGIELNIPIILDEVCSTVIQFKEIISYLNTQKRPLIFLPYNKQAKIDKLIVISTPNFIPLHYKNLLTINAADTLISKSNIEFLNNILISQVKPGIYPLKLYLSRKNASKRRTFNENEIEDLLNKEGFFSFIPTAYSVSEQLSFFYHAEIIVGATGAAFTNLFICKENCKIICLTNYKTDLSIFSTIANIKQIDLVYLYDKQLFVNKKSKLQNSFTINCDDLKNLL